MADYLINFALVYERIEEADCTCTVLAGIGDQELLLTDLDDSNDQFTLGETLLVGETFEGVTTIDGYGYTFIVTYDEANGLYFLNAEVPAELHEALFQAAPVSFSDLRIDTAPFTVCFAAGTPIATPHGERPVETLTAGDRVVTADGRSVPVKWIGRQTLHKVFMPAERFCPVRIRAGALGPDMPHSDLVLTGDHGVLVGEVMVNAAALVNGTSIERVPAHELADSVTYYHVETADHDVILAAGAPAETYLDATARHAFDNYGEYLALFGEPDGAMPVLPYPRAFGPRQLPPRVRERIAERAGAIGAVSPARRHDPFRSSPASPCAAIDGAPERRRRIGTPQGGSFRRRTRL